eukprot:TRINITY_DN2024_c0_g1_i2.p1 TRINITY_DN2024_c0_g1~~TRINITY_DN2024_c0_g1_i2.p1  ORF type:complete len:475 (-),score=24.19 TRINITY_DN2024_c0_g1_i2:1361-2785(-)
MELINIQVSSLSSLCLLKVVQYIKEKNENIIPFLKSLPLEVTEKLIMSALAKNQLDNNSLLAMVPPQLRRLDLPRYGQGIHPDDRTIEFIVSYCISLQEVSLHGCKLTTPTLHILASKHLNLVKLDLSSCSFNSFDVRAIILNCMSLEILDLCGCPIIDETFSPLPPTPEPTNLVDDCCMKVVEEYEETHSHHHHSGSKRKREENEFSPLEMHLVDNPSRKRAKLPTEHYGSDCGHLRSSTYSRSTTPILKELKISGCVSLTSKSLDGISRLFPNLEAIDCSHLVMPLDIRPLLSRCTKLKSIDISGCNLNQDTEMISMNAELKLENIHFSGSGQITIHFAHVLASCAPHLKQITLRNKVFVPSETESNPTFWLKGTSTIKNLDLYGGSFGNDFFIHLINNKDTLEVLDITHAQGAFDEIETFARTPFPELRSLTFNQPLLFKYLPEMSLTCPNIEHLCLNLDMKVCRRQYNQL